MHASRAPAHPLRWCVYGERIPSEERLPPAQVPYIALRASPPPAEPLPAAEQPRLLQAAGSRTGSRALGAVGAAVGAISVGWLALAGGPEYGALPERLEHLQGLFATDRIWLFFAGDCLLYSLFQAWLITDEVRPRSPISFAFVPSADR